MIICNMTNKDVDIEYAETLATFTLMSDWNVINGNDNGEEVAVMDFGTINQIHQNLNVEWWPN